MLEGFDRAGARTYDTRPMSSPPAELNVATPSTVLDAEVLAHAGLTWEGEFNGTRFARLQGVALSDTPRVTVRLAFALLDQRPVVHGKLLTEFELVCQRCLGAMRHPVAEQFELMLIASHAELERVPEACEPWISNPQRLNVFELVEEQLLLALPLIAKHDNDRDCVQKVPNGIQLDSSSIAVEKQVPQSQQSDAVQRPFGNLRDLLRK